MKIGHVVVHPLRLPLPRPLKTSIHDVRAVDTVLVELDWWEPLFAARLAIVDGAVVLPDRPGIGLGLDRAALTRYRA